MNNQNKPFKQATAYTDDTPVVASNSSQMNNTQEVPQVKSVEEYYPGIQYQELFDHMSNEHGLNLLQSEMDEIINICSSMGSKQRIAELEKQNAVYRELLIECNDTFACQDITDRKLKCKINDALNHKQ